MTDAPEAKPEDRKADFPQAGTGGYTWHLLKEKKWQAVCGLVEDEGSDRFTSLRSKVTCPKCLKVTEDAKP